MTICVQDNYNAKKFFERCMYRGSHKDCTFPNFREVQMLTDFKQISVESEMTCEEVENLLKENKVKYLWVSQF